MLARWRQRHLGGQGFTPQAIRRMPLSTQLELARNPALDEAWQEHERELIAQDPAYFIEGYGSVEPPRGAAIPFQLWPSQAEVLDQIRQEDKVWILKARRLGLTWLVLHLGFWIAAFDPENETARVLVVCKNQGGCGQAIRPGEGDP